MTMLVTLQQASDHLRRDTADDDADLTLKVRAASSAVIRYLKSGSPYELELDSNGDPALDSSGAVIPVLDSAGDPVVLYDVQAATLLLIGEFYRNRDGEQQGEVDAGYGYLPRPVVALLYPLRDPALA